MKYIFPLLFTMLYAHNTTTSDVSNLLTVAASSCALGSLVTYITQALWHIKISNDNDLLRRNNLTFNIEITDLEQTINALNGHLILDTSALTHAIITSKKYADISRKLDDAKAKYGDYDKLHEENTKLAMKVAALTAEYQDQHQTIAELTQALENLHKLARPNCVNAAKLPQLTSSANGVPPIDFSSLYRQFKNQADV